MQFSKQFLILGTVCVWGGGGGGVCSYDFFEGVYGYEKRWPNPGIIIGSISTPGPWMDNFLGLIVHG